MDPTQNLKDQRAIATRVLKCEDSNPRHADTCTCTTDAARLSELVIALNEWIGRGGALPSQWANKGGR